MNASRFGDGSAHVPRRPESDIPSPHSDDPPAPPATADSSVAPYELSVIIPTFDERDNIVPMVETLTGCLKGIAWEAIFVDDDSPDGTASLVRELSGRYPNIRCIQRIGRRGLSSACIEGMLASSAPYLAVTDADLQHDVGVLPMMLNTLKRDQLEVVVGSRYVSGGGTGDWARARVRISEFATKIAKLAMRADLKDPVSGFFIIRRSFLDETVHRMSGKGFKILLDMFMSSKSPVRFAEIPYEMRRRTRGESKLGIYIAWEYMVLIADKLIGRFVPIRFIMFILVGAGGACVHLATLATLYHLLAYPFLVGQGAATLLAMTANFFLNNILTYRDRRLRGWQIAWGLSSFYLACGLGAFINIVLADFLFGQGVPWWLSGLLGALSGAVWNFAVTSSFTWNTGTRKPPPDADASRPDLERGAS